MNQCQANELIACALNSRKLLSNKKGINLKEEIIVWKVSFGAFKIKNLNFSKKLNC